MDPNTVVSAVATVIALAAWGFTIQQTRVARAHNRPVCAASAPTQDGFRAGQRAGLLLRNVGLGRARIRLRRGMAGWPQARRAVWKARDRWATYGVGRQATSSVGGHLPVGAILATDDDAFLLSVDPFDRDEDAEFVGLIGRLRIVIVYESLYGDRDVLDWFSSS